MKCYYSNTDQSIYVDEGTRITRIPLSEEIDPIDAYYATESPAVREIIKAMTSETIIKRGYDNCQRLI